MPNKEKRKTRRQRRDEQGVDPSTKGDRGKCIVARMTERCPKLYQEIADLRAQGLWRLKGDDERTHEAIRRKQHNDNSKTVTMDELFEQLNLDFEV